MPSNNSSDYIESLKVLLLNHLEIHLRPVALVFLNEQLSGIKNRFSIRSFFIAYSAAFRFIGKEQLYFTDYEIKILLEINPSWAPREMKAFEMARLLVFLHLPIDHKETYFQIVNKLFGASDMTELSGLFRSLIYYPFKEDFQMLAVDGLRSNIKQVFEAIALDNPYPSLFFSMEQWNQMILKAIFNGSPLFKIIGLEQRANPLLSQQLSDYAHERWAAQRAVNPELWRVAAIHSNKQLIEDYKRLFDSSSILDKEAAALACASANLPEAKRLLEDYPILKARIEKQELNWDEFSKRWYQTMS